MAVTSLLISVIFFIYKFIEMRYVIKENKPPKQFFKDMVIIFICSFIGMYLINIINTNINHIIQPTAYTCNPDF
jgi:hypothetical protein